MGVTTYNAYCIAPSFLSWLGRGTSRRTLPVTLSCGPSTSWVFCISVADLAEEDDMNAEGPARRGRRADEGLTMRC